MDAADFVLAKFAKEENDGDGDWRSPLAADAAEMWVRDGIAACMNRYN